MKTNQVQEVAVIPFNKDEILNKLYTACRTCYTAGTPQEQYEKCENTEYSKKWSLLKHVIDSGHHSVLEHVSFTFMISGVSRALTHQLVRHRIGASYSQQSQRYCAFKDGFQYVTPPSIQKNEEACEKFNYLMSTINECYDILLANGVPAEDARMVLPNACTSNITVTMNLRELIHFCNERLCTCAQWEIRQLAKKMSNLIIQEIPELKPYLSPKCSVLGYCNENESRTCGRKPIKSVALQQVYILSEKGE